MGELEELKDNMLIQLGGCPYSFSDCRSKGLIEEDFLCPEHYSKCEAYELRRKSDYQNN